MRILDVINRTAPFFEKHGVDSPRLTIELLLAHLLKKKRLELYLEFERELDEAVLEKLRELVRRRAGGEPLQYITGESEFCGLTLAVDRRVLIPRPETELLVETVLELVAIGPIRPIGPMAGQRSAVRIIDVGTGSGCIAVALAKKLMAAEVIGVDSSAEALEVAQANAARHGVEKNIRFLQGDLLSEISDSLRAEVVVSNPPYVATGELARLSREVRDFEPVHALVAGEDGLEVIRRLVMDARRVLLADGWLALEIGAGQAGAVERLLVDGGYKVDRVVKDLQGHARVVVSRPPK